MGRETSIQRDIMRELGKGDVRLFRVNVGQGWTGPTIIRGPGTYKLGPRDVLIRDAYPLRTGVPNGFSDLCGWRTVEITPEMVGQRLAVFAAVEVKAPRGRLSDDQENFLGVVERAGGLAGVARSVEQAQEIINGGLLSRA